MKLKNVHIGLASLGAVTIIALGAAYKVKADQPQGQNNDRGLIRESIEQKDYESFVQAIDKQIEELSSLKSRENFEKLQQAHELRQSGDYEQAREIIQEMGIDFPRMGKGIGIKNRVGNHRELRQIIEQGDYEKFQEAVQDKKISEIIDSQEKFEKLVKAHNLREKGDHEQAQEIMDELGLRPRGPGPGNRGHGNGNIKQ
ncbi:MAG: hypothetical protein GF335_00500 [Candidatus Moranbacteria bacterium]|nr:hypothetical protein [Candidatus Moranbacteria bacterium]